MLYFYFSKKAEKELGKLDVMTQKIIMKKLEELKDEGLFEAHTRVVQNLPPATHRIRIGNYRLLIERSGDEVDIFSLGHRREIYK